MDLKQFRKQFPNEEVCRQYLETVVWPRGRKCPHCRGLKFWLLSGASARPGLYECSDCNGQYMVTTKTPIHSTRLPLRISLLAMHFMIHSSKGVSSVFRAKWLGVNQKTAWKISRAMMAANATSLGRLDGIVKLDEKYLGKPRFLQGGKDPRGKATKKACIHVAVSRKGPVRAGLIPDDSYAVLAPYIKQVVSPKACVMTDQLSSYVAIGKQFASHERVHYGIKEFARGQVHDNTAESFNAILERAKQGVFNFVSRRHLPRYISEVAFRWNNRDPLENKRNGLSKIVMQAKPVLEQLGVFLNQAVGTQLRQTIYGGVVSPQTFWGG